MGSDGLHWLRPRRCALKFTEGIGTRARRDFTILPDWT